MTEGLIWTGLRWLATVALGVFLAWLILRVLSMFLREMDGSASSTARPGVWIEANWGGLGGGLSGWRISNAVIYLLLLTLLLGCLSLTVVSLPSAVEKKAEASKEGAPAESKADSGKKDNQKKDVEKKEPEQKPEETKTPDASNADKNLKKSANPPADGKKAGK